MEIQDILGYLLNSCAKLIKRSMDNYLGKYNITTSQWAVIKLLDTRKCLSQTQIADELKADKATVGEIIARLSEKKLLEKTLDPRDKRSYSIHLTAEAESMVGEIEAMADKVTKKALVGFSHMEEQQLFRSLNRIIENLSEEVQIK